MQFLDGTGSLLAPADSTPCFFYHFGHYHFVLQYREFPAESGGQLCKHSLMSRVERRPIAIEQPHRSQVLHGASLVAGKAAGSDCFSIELTLSGTQVCKVSVPDGVQSVTGRSWGKVVVGFEVNDMPDRIHRASRSSRESTVVAKTTSSTTFREHSSRTPPRRWAIALSLGAFFTVVLLLPSVAFAQQSPWERAASNLEFTFTGPLARSLALVAIVIGGLMFMFGEGGAKRQISGIVFGGGLALFAAQFMTWLF